MQRPGHSLPSVQARRKHPFAELDDQAGMFGDRDELRTARYRPRVGWVQRDKCFDAEDGVAAAD